MDKKGMELSINFIIILIFSVTIFAFGIILFQQMFSMGPEIEKRISADMESKIQNYLLSGERVAVPINTRDVSSGDVVFFGVGLLNIDPEGDVNTFEVVLSHVNAYTFENKEISQTSQKKFYGANKMYLSTATNNEPAGWKSWKLSPVTLKNNDNDIVEFPIQIPSGVDPGTYIIDLQVNCVSSGCSQSFYGMAKVYVKVR